jgi:hypothetical protein
MKLRISLDDLANGKPNGFEIVDPPKREIPAMVKR